MWDRKFAVVVIPVATTNQKRQWLLLTLLIASIAVKLWPNYRFCIRVTSFVSNNTSDATILMFWLPIVI